MEGYSALGIALLIAKPTVSVPIAENQWQGKDGLIVISAHSFAKITIKLARYMPYMGEFSL